MKIIATKTDKEFLAVSHTLMTETMGGAIRNQGYCIVGLSGGSTPRPIYEALGQEKNIDWMKVWIFLVDDRYVPADNPNSNQFLLRSSILKHAPIPESRLIVPDTTLPMEECIDLYGRHLADLLKKGPPDLITLGMGEDGHIASLFPPLTDAAFGPALTINTQTESFSVKQRISVTIPVLEQAKRSVFFLKGPGKKKVWDTMMSDAADEKRWPAKRVIEKTPVTVFLSP